MIPLSGVRIHVAVKPVDMRKSFNGLSQAVRTELEQDPLSGHLFVFLNRSLDQVRVLWWHQGGYCILSRRLEQGRFRHIVRLTDRGSIEVNGMELMMLLDGIDVNKVRRTRVWEAAG